MARVAKITLSVLVVIAVLIWSAPYVLYFVGLNNVAGRPVPSSSPPATNEQIAKVQAELRATGISEIPQISPWGYLRRMYLLIESEELNHPAMKETIVPGYVAKIYCSENLKNRRNAYWHLSNVSLTIWLTSNWSDSQLYTKAYENLAAAGAI